MTSILLNYLLDGCLRMTDLASVGSQFAIGLYKDNFQCKIVIFSYSSILTFVLSAQKGCLIETVLLSIHNQCFS